LDAEGRTLAVRDPRGNLAIQNFHDLHGRACRTIGDRGDRRALQDVLGKEIFAWDAKGNRIRTFYDALHRPTDIELRTAAAVTTIIGRSVYGTNPAANQNNQLIEQYDDSGLLENTQYDFKGNLLSSRRRYTTATIGDVDWTTPNAVTLGAPLVTTQAYDALNRVVTIGSPDGSTIAQTYSESGLLATVDVAIHGAPPVPFITRIEHDAKGQRTSIAHGNGVTTSYTYDAKTFRVRRIRTVRSSDNAVLQDLQYTYDPRGNVTSIRDLAQQTVFFNNQLVPPHTEFVFDATYRLVEATGREHVAGNVAPDRTDSLRTNLPHRADGNAMQRYRQQYEYDAAGNMRAMVHSSGAGPFLHRWTRTFTPEGASDRLVSSDVGPLHETFAYDVHGNLESMTGLGTLAWDALDRLRNVSLGGGGNARYTYDHERLRLRKVVTRAGNIVEERLYGGAVEIFTRTQNGTLELRRETLHVMDGGHRVAMVDTRTDGAGPGPAQLIRYQFANHLGTAALELDHAGAVIAYEEYYPFGSTSLQSVDATREVPARRYRYTGKERDEETGFSYHEARYYAPWLARWTSGDPAGLVDGTNVHRYARNNPVVLNDPSGMDPPSSFDVGPFRFQPRLNWLHLEEEGGPTNPELRTLMAPRHPMNIGRIFGGDLELRGDFSMPLVPAVTGTMHGRFDVGFYRPPVGPDVFTAMGTMTLRMFGFLPVRFSGTAEGISFPDERTFRLTQPFAEGRPSWSFDSPGARLGELDYRGWLSVGPIPAARVWGSARFGDEVGGVRGTFNILPMPPVAFAWGSFSNIGSRFSADVNYVGPQFGPIGIGVDADPYRALHDPESVPPQIAAMTPRPTPGGTVEVFQPGFSVGYTRAWIRPTWMGTLSVGVAPTPSIEQISPGQRSLPIPGMDRLLYGREITTPVPGPYFGAAFRLRF
ncbi:MAG TPA: RHS repeat-associated core domain-containing protein, partial [Thermoanaerobaculia bacterium]|nr:RHS repeat-associated core domain-containing protein [Thermoanaerobaculia bacterium]